MPSTSEAVSGAPMLYDGPADGPTLVLAHGAGAPMDSPFMAAMARGLAGRGVRVVRFEFPYMSARRHSSARRPPDRGPVLERVWLETIAALGATAGGAPFIGGKSLGGRIASLIADRAGVRGLVCLGYPFRPPGQAPAAGTGAPRALTTPVSPPLPPAPGRVAHLAGLRTPTLIVQGTRDPFGGPDEVAGYALSAAIRVHWLPDGDHSFKPRRASGRTEAENLAEAVAVVAAFVRGEDQEPVSDGEGSDAGR
jgi:predicted alpha/beta-hydrolase family hydrolase